MRGSTARNNDVSEIKDGERERAERDCEYDFEKSCSSDVSENHQGMTCSEKVENECCTTTGPTDSSLKPCMDETNWRSGDVWNGTRWSVKEWKNYGNGNARAMLDGITLHEQSVISVEWNGHVMAQIPVDRSATTHDGMEKQWQVSSDDRDDHAVAVQSEDDAEHDNCNCLMDPEAAHWLRWTCLQGC